MSEVSREAKDRLFRFIFGRRNVLPDDSPIKAFVLDNRAEVKRMCITEYDEVRTMNMFREEGRAEGMEKGLAERMEKGRSEGANLLGALISKLIKLGRHQDIERVATDSEYREQLYREFGIA